MKAVNDFRDTYKREGLRKAIQQFFRACIGIEDYEERFLALNYFLNAYNDVTALPPTKDADLRILQECDALLLGIFDKICRRHGLSYWLDFGTLLGAYRHKGFIPWDDDMDICMPREDFDKVVHILREELTADGFLAQEMYQDGMDVPRSTFSFRHKETGIWLDIFPMDMYAVGKAPDKDERQILADRVRKYRKAYRKIKDRTDRNAVGQCREKWLLGGVNRNMVRMAA